MMAVGDEAGEQMDDEVHRAAMAGVLDLTDVFELIVDGLDERAFAQEELLGEVHQDGAHVLAEFLRSLVMRRTPWSTTRRSARGGELEP
jgi:hypothetical protein